MPQSILTREIERKLNDLEKDEMLLYQKKKNKMKKWISLLPLREIHIVSHVEKVSPENSVHAPVGIDDKQYLWIDLFSDQKSPGGDVTIVIDNDQKRCSRW